MDATAQAALVALVHRGVLASDGWHAFVAALCKAMPATHANLTLRRTDAPMSDVTSFASGVATEELGRIYFDSFYRDDPLPYFSLIPGRAYTMSSLFRPDDTVVQERLKTLLEPFRDPDLMIVRITGPGGANAWLTVIRDVQPFTGDERAAIEQLGEHLEIALETYIQLADGQARLHAYTSAMDRLNVGIVTLTRDGQIIDADALVSRLLAEGEMMTRDPQGRLVLADAAAARSLTSAMRDFARQPGGRPRALRLSQSRRADMLLLPVVDRPATGRFTPVLRAYVHTDARPARDSLEILIELFHLTRSEARLAHALAEGHTLAEASTLLGVTLQTARTYSKRIFQKTGTRRQAELVRALLTSTLSLA